MICLRGHQNCEHPIDCAKDAFSEMRHHARVIHDAALGSISARGELSTSFIASDAIASEAQGSPCDDTIACCVDVLIAEPFSMREDRAVEVARAVLKAALDR